jgi:hypothetical protein
MEIFGIIECSTYLLSLGRVNMPSKIEHAKVNRLVFSGKPVGYRFTIYYIGGEQKVYDVDNDSIKTDKLQKLDNMYLGKDANLIMRAEGEKLITFQDTLSGVAIEDISDKPVIIGSIIKKVLEHLKQATDEDEDTPFFIKNGLALFNPSVEVVFDNSGFLYREWALTIVATEPSILSDIAELSGQGEFDQDAIKKTHDESYLVLEASDLKEDALAIIMSHFQCPISIFGNFALHVLCTDKDKLVNGFSENQVTEMTLKSGIVAQIQYSPGFDKESAIGTETETLKAINVFDTWHEHGNAFRYYEDKIVEDVVEYLTTEAIFKAL